MATEDKSIKRRRGTEAALKATGQLIDGQAGFCSDKKKILFKRPATWASPGTIDEYDFDGLQANIDAEADARAEADQTLQENIDAKEDIANSGKIKTSASDTVLGFSYDKIIVDGIIVKNIAVSDTFGEQLQIAAVVSPDNETISGTGTTASKLTVLTVGYKLISTEAEFLEFAASYNHPRLWIGQDISVNLPATLYIRAPVKKTIDGPGTITLIGNATASNCNVYGSTDPTSNNVEFMGNASIDFQCPVLFTQYFTCHKSRFRFQRCSSSAINNTTLYGVVADSEAVIRFGFSDLGYAGFSQSGDSETLVYEGHESRLFYSATVTKQTISDSTTIYPRPNFVYNVIGPITVTLVAPRVEGSLIAFDSDFFILHPATCDLDTFIVAPDQDGNSVSYKIRNTGYGNNVMIKVKQMGVGYILSPVWTPV